MLAAIKMEVMAPSTESPDEGSIGYDQFTGVIFHDSRVVLLLRLCFIGL